MSHYIFVRFITNRLQENKLQEKIQGNKNMYLEGYEDNEVTDKVGAILSESGTKVELKTLLDVFKETVNSPFAKRFVKTKEERLELGLNAVKAHIESKTFSAKPTIRIPVVLRSVSAVVSNNSNVTEATKDLPKSEQIGIAGNWKRCLDCGRKFDGNDHGMKCPKCGSTSSVILARQEAPPNTIGVVNRTDMKTGDISVFNRATASIFVVEDEKWKEAFINFSGNFELLEKTRTGEAFDITVDEEVYEGEGGLKWYKNTGTSAKFPYSGSLDPNILKIYDEMYQGEGKEDEGRSLITSVGDAVDDQYYAFFLMVVGEPRQAKEGGKWIVNLIDPLNESSEPLTMYLSNRRIATQFKNGDAGIFECKFTTLTSTIKGKVNVSRVVNVTETKSGLPIYLIGKGEEVRTISV